MLIHQLQEVSDDFCKLHCPKEFSSDKALPPTLVHFPPHDGGERIAATMWLAPLEPVAFGDWLGFVEATCVFIIEFA